MAGHQKAERIHGPRTRTCRDILWDTRLVESVFLAISEENRMAEGAQAQLGPSPGLWRPRGRARLSADTPSHPVTLRGGRLCQPQVVQISHIFHKPVSVIICFKKNPDCPSSQQQRLDLWTSRSRPCATPSGALRHRTRPLPWTIPWGVGQWGAGGTARAKPDPWGGVRPGRSVDHMTTMPRAPQVPDRETEARPRLQ